MDTGILQYLGAAVPQPGVMLGIFLLSVRLAALFLLTPVLYAGAVPVTVRVLLTLGLAAVLGPHAESATGVELAHTGIAQLFAAALGELAVGATMAVAVLAAFAAISMAGRLIDVQIGFGMAQIFDPLTRRQVPIVTSAFDRLGVVVFFMLNGPHALLRGITYSIERVPVGTAWGPQGAWMPVVKQAGAVFAMGFSLAAPVIACLLLVELALGVVARNLPQMNMLVIGIPVKIVVGLAALAIWHGGMGDALERVYGSIYRTWDGVLAPLPATKAVP